MAHSKILITRQAICEYLQVGKKQFYELIDEGLPAVRVKGKWVSHTALIDDYFLEIIKGGDHEDYPYK